MPKLGIGHTEWEPVRLQQGMGFQRATSLTSVGISLTVAVGIVAPKDPEA